MHILRVTPAMQAGLVFPVPVDMFPRITKALKSEASTPVLAKS